MMDANEYARKVAPAAQALAVVLRSAEWISGSKANSVVTPGPVRQAVVAAPRHTEPVTVETRPPEREPVAITAGDAELLSLAADAEREPPTPIVREESIDPSSINLTLGDRSYRVRGLEKNLSYAQLKVVLRVARGELLLPR